MFRDELADICSCNICTSTIRGGRMSQRARKAVQQMSMDGQADICSSVIAPALPYYCPSVDICNICTSTIRGGRMSQ